MNKRENYKKLLEDIVRTTMTMHPSDCIFKTDTLETSVDAAINFDENSTKEEIIDALATAFSSCELYCPHEQINRMPTI